MYMTKFQRYSKLSSMIIYIYMIFDCLFVYVYFTTPFIVTLLRYVSIELKELLTYHLVTNGILGVRDGDAALPKLL